MCAWLGLQEEKAAEMLAAVLSCSAAPTLNEPSEAAPLIPLGGKEARRGHEADPRTAGQAVAERRAEATKEEAQMKKQAEENAAAITKMNPTRKMQALRAMPKAEKGATLAALPPEQRREILKDLPPEEKQEAMAAIQVSKQAGKAEALTKMNPNRRGEVLEAMHPEEKGAVLAQLTVAQQEAVLDDMPVEQRTETLISIATHQQKEKTEEAQVQAKIASAKLDRAKYNQSAGNFEGTVAHPTLTSNPD